MAGDVEQVDRPWLKFRTAEVVEAVDEAGALGVIPGRLKHRVYVAGALGELDDRAVDARALGREEIVGAGIVGADVDDF